MPVPNAVAAFPGRGRVATKLMERRINDNGTATIEELMEVSIESGVDPTGLQMTIDLMEYDEEDFYDGVTAGSVRRPPSIPWPTPTSSCWYNDGDGTPGTVRARLETAEHPRARSRAKDT